MSAEEYCKLIEKYAKIHGVHLALLSEKGLPICWKGGKGDQEAVAALASNLATEARRELNEILGDVSSIGVDGSSASIIVVRLDGVDAVFLVDKKAYTILAPTIPRLKDSVPCPKCGTNLARETTQCPHCGATIPFLAHQCPSCGELVVVKKCPKCGARVDITGRLRRRLGLF